MTKSEEELPVELEEIKKLKIKLEALKELKSLSREIEDFEKEYKPRGKNFEKLRSFGKSLGQWAESVSKNADLSAVSGSVSGEKGEGDSEGMAKGMKEVFGG